MYIVLAERKCGTGEIELIDRTKFWPSSERSSDSDKKSPGEVYILFTCYRSCKKKAKLNPALKKRKKQNNASSLTSSAAIKQDLSFCASWSQEKCRLPTSAVWQSRKIVRYVARSTWNIDNMQQKCRDAQGSPLVVPPFSFSFLRERIG